MEDVVSERRGPAHYLSRIQRAVAAGDWRVTRSAADAAMQLAWDASDTRDCILALDMTDFDKAMESNRCRGRWQDVYRPVFRRLPLYVQLELDPSNRAWVISFKRDESR